MKLLGVFITTVLACILHLVSTGAPSCATEVTLQVVSVLDGDTIEVLHNNRAERLRLNGIDCPEKGQAHGKRAKQATSELVFEK
jgi:endonuclease YncB( thermonuclease family)